MTKETPKPKSFPLEKILTSNAIDYSNSHGSIHSDREYGGLKGYKMVGVHFEGHVSSHVHDPEKDNTIRGIFATKVPQDAEVVVDYRAGNFVYDSHTKSIYGSASGTALIPIPKK